MANSLTTNPWVLDTAAATILFTTDILVDHFEYVGYAAQGNTCLVKDRFGKVVWKGVGDTDLEDVVSGRINWIHGLALTQLDSTGILRVFFK